MTEVLIETTPVVMETIVEEAGEVTTYETVVVVEEVVVEVPGPAGPRGLQGETGPEGGKYEFQQTTPSAAWTVPHGLGRYPSGIQVIASDGAVVGTEIIHDSVNQFRSLSDGAFSGRLVYT